MDEEVLFTPEQENAIRADLYILLETYTKSTIDKIHLYDYDKHLWGDIFRHISFQLQHLYQSSIEPRARELFSEVKKEFYSPLLPMRCNGPSYESPYDISTLTKKINHIRGKPQPEQRTPEWYQFRHNLITASNAWKAVGSISAKNQLIYEKCQPINLDKYQETFGDTPLNWGKKYEDVSVQVYENMYKTKVEEFGCIPHDKHTFLGASPDGINTDPKSTRFGRMLEIKNVVNRELTGIPKLDYWVQTQLQMEVCDLNECDFFETQFLEYESLDAFLLDGSFTHTESGKQKGIFLYFTNNGKSIYKYAPLNLTQSEYNTWEENQMNACEQFQWIKTIYWRLESMSNVLILRHPQWIDWVIPKIEDVWRLVEKERKEGYEHRAPKKREKKEKKMGCLIKIDTEPSTPTG